MTAEGPVVVSSEVESTTVEPDHAIAHSLRSSVMRGLKWSAAIVVTNQLARIATSLVLVRLLAPHDYGLAGMALLFSSLVLAFSDLGLGAGLVQRHSITEEDRSTVFWTSFAVGLVLMLVGMALAAPLAQFFHQPGVRPLFMVVSVSFLFVALQTTQASLFQRAMNFRAISVRSIGSNLAAAAVGITVAVLGGGAWALVAQQLTMSVLGALLLWLASSWMPRLTFSFRSLRTLGGFGLTVLGSRFLDYLQGNTDNLLVGRYLGSSALGLYSVAYNVILLPAQRLFVPIQDTMFPAFARIQHDRSRVASIWLRVTRVVGAVVAPAMLGLVVVAPDFVETIMGQRWSGCVPVLRILAFVTLMQGFTAVAERTLIALGRPSVVFRVSSLRTVLAVGAFAAGLHWGIVGVAAFYTAAMIPLQVYLVAVATHELHIGPMQFIRNISGVAEASLAMFAICWLVRTLLLQTSLGAPLRLVVVIAIGVAAYGLALTWRGHEVVTELKNLRRRTGTSQAPLAT
jgi:polysaccharide transporter, PST family